MTLLGVMLKNVIVLGGAHHKVKDTPPPLPPPLAVVVELPIFIVFFCFVFLEFLNIENKLISSKNGNFHDY